MLSYAFEMNLYGRTVANLTNVHRGGTVQLHCVLHKKSTFLVRVIAVLHRYIYIYVTTQYIATTCILIPYTVTTQCDV